MLWGLKKEIEFKCAKIYENYWEKATKITTIFKYKTSIGQNLTIFGLHVALFF